MERNIEFKAVEPSAQINKRIERLISKLEKTFEDLERQVNRYKENLRGEHRKRQATRQEIRDAEARGVSSEENKREAFFSLITPHLNRLYHFVGHLISYAEGVADVANDKLTAEELVDGALLRAHREFIKGRAIPDVKAWLIRFALDQLEADVARLATAPAEEVSTLGEEILDHYQPDEDLKLDNLLLSIDGQAPENEVERQEVRRLVRKTFMQMPRSWRRVLLLRAIEGRSPREIAKDLGKSQSGIERMMRGAREYLRQRLAGAGYHFKVREERAA